MNTTTEAGLPRTAARRVGVGDQLFSGERIATDSFGTAQVLLVDRSTVTIGPSSDLVIDQLVFDPGTGAGRAVLVNAKGLLRFIGGRLSKDGNVTVRTPSATVAIRGGIATIAVDPATLGTTAVLGFGELTVSAAGETRRVVKPGFAVIVPAPGAPPGPVVPAPRDFLGDAAQATEGPARSGQPADGADPQVLEADLRIVSISQPLLVPPALDRRPPLRSTGDQAGRDGSQAKIEGRIEPRPDSRYNNSSP